MSQEAPTTLPDPADAAEKPPAGDDGGAPNLDALVESLLFVADEPVTLSRLAQTLEVTTARVEKALATLQHADSLDPQAMHPKRKLAELYIRRKDYDKATHTLDSLFKLSKDDSLGRYLQGRLALAQHHIPDAIRILHKLTQDVPAMAAAHYYLGLAHAHNRDAEAAKAAFNEALRLAPRSADTHLALAELYVQTRAFDQAIAAATEALQLRPGSLKAHILQGQAYVGKNDGAAAVAVFTKVTQAMPQHAQSHYYLGRAHRSRPPHAQRTRAPGRADRLHARFESTRIL